MAVSHTLDPDRIMTHLNTSWLGSRVVVYQSTASTNDLAARYADQDSSHGLLVLAEEQTAGRGRGDNRWSSPSGSSVLGSVVMINLPLSPGLLALAATVAVADTLGSQARIKWPNDILIRGKKVSGLLLERKAHVHHTATILGIGINCHQGPEDFPATLRTTATSLDIERGGCTDRETLIRRLLVNLEQWLAMAEVEQAAVVDRWMCHSVQVGHRLTLQYDGRSYQGQCLGVHPEQGLIVQLDRGGIRHFDTAQTHIVRDCTLGV